MYEDIHEKLPLGQSLEDVVLRVKKTLDIIKASTKEGTRTRGIHL